MLQTKWDNGQPWYRHHSNEPWAVWRFGMPNCERTDRWFRLHCPHDRFVMDDGTLLEFVMLSSGEAHDLTGHVGSTLADVSVQDVQGYPGRHALYKFRDRERVKLGLPVNHGTQHARASEPNIQNLPLADNQVRSPKDFTADGSVVVTLRWHEGVPQYKWGSTGWMRVLLYLDSAAFMRAWFRDRCPRDRFVLPDGDLFKFTMQDNGEALATFADRVHVTAPGSTGSHAGKMIRALYEFRDAERARWTTKRITHDALGEVVQVYRDGQPLGWISKRGPSASFSTLYNAPTWVQEMAKQQQQQQLSEDTVEHSVQGFAGDLGPDMIVMDEAGALSEDVRSLRRRNGTLKTSVEALQKKLAEAKAENEELKAECEASDTLKAEVDSLQEQLTEAQVENEELEAERDAAQDALDKLKQSGAEEREEFRQECDTLRKKLAHETKYTKSFNLNAPVWVKLTDAGLKHMCTFPYIKDPEDFAIALREGFYRIQLWELMRVFGPSMSMTGPQMFEGNTLLLEKPKSFEILGAETGRIDSSKPNLSNAPREHQMTPVPPEGLPAEQDILIGNTETHEWRVNLKWVWGSTYRILDVIARNRRTDK